MNNPKVIQTVIEGATYKVPTFKVTNEGLVDGAGIEIVFCKGNKEDEGIFRQEGLITETLIQTAKQYLESVNVGPTACRETSMAITKLDETLMWLNKRNEDRILKGYKILTNSKELNNSNADGNNSSALLKSDYRAEIIISNSTIV